MAKMKVLVCPYCGDAQNAGDRCRACGGLFEPLSRQATHNAMGPWFVRDEKRPFQPGASYETIVKLIERAQVTRYSIVRSPTTKQFWTVARRVPGLAHLLGHCHNCDASVDPGDHGCHACGVPFGAYLDRNFLGLPEIRPLPWEAGGEDELRPAPASPRSIEFRRVAEPVGISSFASDEELRGSGLKPMSSYGSGTSPAGAPSALAAPAGRVQLFEPQLGPTESGAIATLDPDDSLTLTIMQRRIKRQQTTIRMLIIAAMLVAVGAIAAVFALLAAPPQSSEQAPPSHSSGLDELMPAATTTGPAERDWDVDLARADELIAAAQTNDQPTAERIANYEEALRILEAVEANTAPERLPDDLLNKIKSLRSELEQLRLNEFFP